MSFEEKNNRQQHQQEWMRKKKGRSVKKAETTFFKLALSNFDELAPFMIGELFICKKYGVTFSLVC